MRTKHAHVFEIGPREVRLTGLPPFIELPQDGVLTLFQPAYDGLHAQQSQIRDTGNWGFGIVKTLVEMLKLEASIYCFERVHRRLGKIGISSGLYLGNPTDRRDEHNPRNL